jgi:hypothetical protein
MNSHDAIIQFVLNGIPQQEPQNMSMGAQANELAPFARKLGLVELAEFLERTANGGELEA